LLLENSEFFLGIKNFSTNRLVFVGKKYLPDDKILKNKVLKEAHKYKLIESCKEHENV